MALKNCFFSIYSLDYGLKISVARLGEWKLFASNYCLNDTCSDSPVEISIKKFWTRFDYNRAAENDISVIELENDVQFTSKLLIRFKGNCCTIYWFFFFVRAIEWIQPICLPNVNVHKNIENDEKFISSEWNLYDGNESEGS